MIILGVGLQNCVASRGSDPGEQLAEKHREALETAEEGFTQAGDEVEETTDEFEEKFDQLATDLLNTIEDFRKNTLGIALVQDGHHQVLHDEFQKIKHLSADDISDNLRTKDRGEIWFLKTSDMADDLLLKDETEGVSRSEAATRELLHRFDLIEEKLDKLRKEAGIDK